MEKTLQEIKEKLINSKSDEIVYPPGVTSLFDEQNSKFVFKFQFENRHTRNVCVGLLTACMDTKRVVTVEEGYYPVSGGGNARTSDISGPILLNEYKDNVYSDLTGTIIDCIASNSIGPSTVQTVFSADNQALKTLKSQRFSGSWDMLREYVKHTPFRIFEMQFSYDSPRFLDKPLLIRRVRPYTLNETNDINLDEYFEPINVQETKIIIPCDLVVDSETFMAITIPSESKVMGTFKISAAYNTGQALKNKTKTSDFLNQIFKHFKK